MATEKSARVVQKRKHRRPHLIIFAFILMLGVLIYVGINRRSHNNSFLLENHAGDISTEQAVPEPTGKLHIEVSPDFLIEQVVPTTTGKLRIEIYTDIPNLEIHPQNLFNHVVKTYEWLVANRPSVNTTIPQKLRLFFSKEKLFDVGVAAQLQLSPTRELFRAFHSKVAQYNQGRSLAHPGFTTESEPDSKNVICAFGMGRFLESWDVTTEFGVPRNVFTGLRQNSTQFVTGQRMAHITITHELIHALTFDHEFYAKEAAEALAYGDASIIYDSSKLEIFHLKK